MNFAVSSARSWASLSMIPPPSELLHHGQFMLGPRRPEQLPGWEGRPLANQFWLTTHPTLPVTEVSDANHALVLIGYVLDPAQPLADDRAILQGLLTSCHSVEKLIASTCRLGGRWIMIATCGDGIYLFTDALGLRQVMYTQPADAGRIYALSQPGLAMEVLGLTLDEEAAQFLDSHAFRTNPEYRWPGTSTPVHGLRHLLPNHFLDLHTGQTKRYWPAGPLPEVSLGDALERMTTIVPALIRAAAHRFELVLSLTSGVDSRLVLAAARSVKDEIGYITVRQAKMADDSADLAVPARLLARLGLSHEVIRAASSMSPDFSRAFKRSVLFAHDHYGPDAEAILARYGRRKAAMTGSGAEVGRCSFRKQLPFSDLRRITAKHLAWLQGMNHPYAIRFFSQWLVDAEERANINLLDLFEWEQGHGSWLAMTQLEFDIAWRDIFTPFNCRELLVTLLSVSERFRRSPGYALFHLATRRLWLEVLSEPINPPGGRRLLQDGVSWLRRAWRAHALET